MRRAASGSLYATLHFCNFLEFDLTLPPGGDKILQHTQKITLRRWSLDRRSGNTLKLLAKILLGACCEWCSQFGCGTLQKKWPMWETIRQAHAKVDQHLAESGQMLGNAGSRRQIWGRTRRRAREDCSPVRRSRRGEWECVSGALKSLVSASAALPGSIARQKHRNLVAEELSSGGPSQG